MDNYADHPLTVGERRSERTQDASQWSPRDALISLLREIDEGKLDVEALVIAFRHRAPCGTNITEYRAASPQLVTTVGVLEIAKHQILANRC